MTDRDDKADVKETLEYAQARHQRMVRDLAAQDARIAALQVLLDRSTVYLARHVEHNEKAYGHTRGTEPNVAAYFDEMAEHLREARAALEAGQ